MNKALTLIEALETIITEVTTRRYPEGGAEILNRIHGLAENAVNKVGGREEVEDMFEDLRIKTVDLDVAYNSVTDSYLDRLKECIIPVLIAVDDLTDLGVSGA